MNKRGDLRDKLTKCNVWTLFQFLFNHLPLKEPGKTFKTCM